VTFYFSINEMSRYDCEFTDSERLTRLIFTVEELTDLVHELVRQRTQPTKTWMEPCEFAALLRISTSTLRTWRRDGRFHPNAYRKGPRGYQFHAELALRDAQELSS